MAQQQPNGQAINPEVQMPGQQAWGGMVPTQPMQQIKTSYITAVAVQQPRNLEVVLKDFLVECKLMGEGGYYGWGVGKDRVEGPSIEFAMSAVRCFGNCAVEYDDVRETPTAYFFMAAFIDLEKGVTVRRPFRQSRQWTVYGKMDAERKEDIRFQIGTSKAARNVILRALPGWFVEAGMEECKRSVLGVIEERIKRYEESEKKKGNTNADGLAYARQSTLAELQKLGVSKERVLYKLDLQKEEEIRKDHLVTLLGDIKQLRSGAESAAALYPEPGKQAESEENDTGAGVAEEGQTMADRLKASLRQKEEEGKEEHPTTAQAATPETGQEKPTEQPQQASQVESQVTSQQPSQGQSNSPQASLGLGQGQPEERQVKGKTGKA